MKLFRETTKAWVDDPGDPHFLADGSFLLPSERTGWKHFYHYAATGKLMHPVTSGEWEVRGSGGGIFQGIRCTASTRRRLGLLHRHEGLPQAPTSTAPSSTVRHVERLTPDAGSHSVTVSPEGAMFVDSWSDASTPTRVVLARQATARRCARSTPTRCTTAKSTASASTSASRSR